MDDSTTDADASRPGPVSAVDRCAAVVVNHDAGDALMGCVASLRMAGVREIVVVDNSSGDGSLERLAGADPDAVLVPTGRNLGYGRAVNLGAERTEADYLLVCNPDLVVGPEAAAILAGVLEAEPDCAIAGPRLDDPDGCRYPSARAFPSPVVAAGHALLGPFLADNPWTRRYKLVTRFAPPAPPTATVPTAPLPGSGSSGSPGSGCPGPSKAVEVDWVSGACFLARRSAMSSVGGFDEAYFMYVEDVDLCWRLRRAGWRVVYQPAAVVVHAQGLSTARHPVRMLVAHHRSAWRFARRSTHGPARALLPAMAVVLAGRLVVVVACELTGRFLGVVAARERVNTQ